MTILSPRNVRVLMLKISNLTQELGNLLPEIHHAPWWICQMKTVSNLASCTNMYCGPMQIVSHWLPNDRARQPLPFAAQVGEYIWKHPLHPNSSPVSCSYGNTPFHMLAFSIKEVGRIIPDAFIQTPMLKLDRTNLSPPFGKLDYLTASAHLPRT